MINENRIKRKGIVMLLILALVVTGLFSYPNTAYADKVVLSEQTYYHLDMGVQIAYQGSEWESRGFDYGDTEQISSTVSFPSDVEVIDAYPLNSSKGSSFDFDGDTSSTNIPNALKNDVGSAADAYDQFYKDYTSTSMSVNGTPSSNGNEVEFSYNAKLNTTTALEAVSYGYNQYDDDIWKLFGGKNNVQNAEVKAAIENALLQGLNGTANGNKLYIVFCPTVIKYKKYVTVGDLEADLNLPSTAKQADEFNVADATQVDSSLTLESSQVRYRVDGGSWQGLVTWNGKGATGVNTGGEITQKFDDVCVVDYEIFATATNGQVDTAMKTIKVTDGREVNGKAILELPEYTYEGHPALAKDVSVFTVNGVNYSARRAYEEGVADNDFMPLPYLAGSASKKTLTTADVVFPRRGNYNVKLEVNTVSGNTLSDTKPIEVRKTPYIIDSLGGFQKENRKQSLSLSVATYPGKPIIDYYIKLKDMVTGQEITLTKDAPQLNNATIKTRTITNSGDTYWTNYELLFLTKNAVCQDYQYTIYMKDSKGDTDTVQKTFTVSPDLPPNPEIEMQDSFLRNKGTNVAEIIAEDASTTDGDQLARTWSLDGRNIKSLDGYKDLSFGSGQNVRFNKTGVGKVNLNLFLKDVWIESTLEEYITETDYKIASITKTSDVINIAPTVRLEPKNMIKADIVIVTEKKNKAQIGAGINALKAALIEMGYDPNISLAVAADADEGTYREVANWTYNTTVNCGICNNNTGLMDSEYFYRVTSPGKKVEYQQEICVADQPHVLQALSAGTTANSGYIVWSYPVNESRSFKIYLDNKEKYVYIACSDTNKTTILNRDNGAYLTTLNVAIPGSPLVGDDPQNIYFIDSLRIQKYDTSSGTLSTVINRGGSLTQMMDGKITFVGKKETGVKQNKNGVGFYIGEFDINSETVREVAIPDLPSTTGVVSPIDLDSTGKVLFKQGSNLWVAETLNNTVKMTTQAGIGDHMNSTVFVKNEMGEGVSIAHAYNNTDYKSNSYFYFALYDFSGSSIQCVSTYGDDFYGYNWNGLSYAKLHSKENKIYILQGSNFEGLTGLNYDPGYCLRISLPSMSIDTSRNSWGWDIAEETGMYNGSLMATYYKLERWYNQSDRIQLFRNSITEQAAKTLALRQNAQSENDDSEKYVIVAGDNAASQILQDQGFKNEIDLRGARTLVYNVEDAITTIAQQIKELGDSLKNYLLLEGDSFNNLASIKHDIQLLPNTDYEYEYTMTTTGKAIDLFGVKNPNSQGLENDGKYFEKTAVFIDFNSGLSEPFFTMSGAGTNPSWFAGYGSYTNYSADAGFATTFTMEKDGYVSFDLYMGWGSYKSGTNSLTYTVDGVTVGTDSTYGYGTIVGSPRIIYLTEGAHTISFYHHVTNNSTHASINNLKAVYYEDTADAFSPATVTAAAGKEQTIINCFKVAGQETMQTGTVATQTLITKSGIEYSKYISSSSTYDVELWDSVNRRYYYQTYTGSPLSFTESTGTYFIQGSGDHTYPIFNITAPADKFLIYSYVLSYAGGNINDTSQIGERLHSGTEIRILRPGQTQTLSATMGMRSKGDRIPRMYVSNIKIAEFAAANFGGAAALQSMYINMKNTTIKLINEDKHLILSLNNATGSVKAEYMSGISSTSTSLNNGISLSTSESSEKISALVSNFSLYRKIGGIRQLIFSQNFNSQNALDLTGWKTTLLGDGKAKIVSAKAPAKEEDAPLVYKQGQLVAYNIYYDDYENDPSKKQYWRYTHTPMNDGPNPQAAVILDEDGNVVSSTGAILFQSIPRFYIDGKYTVEHWQEDNTNRTGNASGSTDYTKYDKLSNVESITFYIEGGATAPWITSIKTIPLAVKEGDQYQLQIGVDDVEKDILRLTTEIYKDKKLIYTHKQTNIVADAKGTYPCVITGYPPIAEPGRYDVVCTVRDWAGAGIGSYKFTVISEGKITGFVNHTDQWDNNRKKYNLKRFSEEANRQMQLDDYLAMSTPRKRGTNVFWSGEKFMLQSETEGRPSSVKVQIYSLDSQGNPKSTVYSTELFKTARKTATGAELWEGSLWDEGMINKWGRKTPEQLLFYFTAYYSGGTTKNHEVTIIVDSKQDYWQLHRLW